MRDFLRGCVLAVGLPAWIQFGCSHGGDAGRAPHAAASLAELNPADRTAAEVQRLCPVSGEPLGSMGVPVRADVKGTSIFMCCKECLTKAVAHPDATLARVAEFRTRPAHTP